MGASLQESRQLIEGKLRETREPRNVQVEVIDSARGSMVIKLRDEEGIFMEIPTNEETEVITERRERRGSESYDGETQTERREGMTSSGPSSPPHVGDADDTRAREGMEQELEAVRRQLEMANTQIRTLEEELAETQETYRRSLEEKTKR